MALEPVDEQHAAQILAGTDGRLFGHRFEERLAHEINVLGEVGIRPTEDQFHRVEGWPAVELLSYIARDQGIEEILGAEAWWAGGLATARSGDRILGHTGIVIPRSKSDVIIEITHDNGTFLTGVGVKTCNKRTPTNAQLYFTTAVAFVGLLRSHGIRVSDDAETALRAFCGDSGYRPQDMGSVRGRIPDPTRWFWEELPDAPRLEWERLLTKQQDAVTTVLLSFAYDDDPIPPEYLLHQRTESTDDATCPLAIYSINEIVRYSREYGGFSTKGYVIRKGSFKHDDAVHLAPRFGFVQFQRGGQKQHPTQLQFNLQAGYFNHTPLRP